MHRSKAITLKQLRAVAALADHGTITAAAEAVHLTAPAVHTQLRALEANLGTALMQKSRAGRMQLTEAGKLAVLAARRIETELQACAAGIDAISRGYSGRVRLGVVSTGKYFAPFLVATLREAYPDIEVVLTIGNRNQIIEALEMRAVELAIMGRPPRAPRVTAETLGPHPHVLIAAPDHPFAGRVRIDADGLMAETFIAREEGSGTRILMNRYLDRVGDGRIYKVMVMGSNETIKQAVIAGLGIALISEHTVIEELRSGRLVTLQAEGLPIERHWFLIERSDSCLTPAAARIKQAVSDLRGDFLPRLERDGS
ncbi:MAG: LysR family transcriptional regulator [Rhodobacter sp.]|nr:LysR family transcriptional regulator [Rhodobacter sp.]